MPTSTDLVTDLPADFEVFGQAVDTSLADLKGGTTGQVLSKASNTNMDFTWVTTDDANAIQNTIVDAKGDLIGATAADTPARLAVGTNGQVLTADSTAATGLAWTTPSSGFTYTTWTPTYNAGISVGNGTVVARYAQSGKMVHAFWKFTLGSTSSVSGNLEVSLPVTGSSNAVGTRGTGSILDSGVRWFTAGADMNQTTKIVFICVGANLTYAYEEYLSATVPMTWANGDVMTFSIIYEAA
jgi:hypothetical protein